MDAVTTTDILSCCRHCGYATTLGAPLYKRFQNGTPPDHAVVKSVLAAAINKQKSSRRIAPRAALQHLSRSAQHSRVARSRATLCSRLERSSCDEPKRRDRWLYQHFACRTGTGESTDNSKRRIFAAP